MSIFHLNPTVTSVEQLEVHYVNSFFAILHTVFHGSLHVADANLRKSDVTKHQSFSLPRKIFEIKVVHH